MRPRMSAYSTHALTLSFVPVEDAVDGLEAAEVRFGQHWRWPSYEGCLHTHAHGYC